MGIAVRFLSLALVGAIAGCSTGLKTLPTTETQRGEAPDIYQWLEEVESARALDWVNAHNEPTLKQLESDSRYAPVLKDLREVMLATDRIHLPAQRGSKVYHFLQDAKHTRGIWRRTTIGNYLQKNPRWETVLDMDNLATTEKENWVYKAADCLEPLSQRCLLTLSRGGKDASVLREFDTKTKRFVTNGFQLPEAKSDATWLDRDTLLVATDFGPGSLTLSGYARIVKLWKRGTRLSDATTLFEGKETDVSSSALHVQRPEGNYSFVYRSPTFFEQEYYLLGDDRMTLTKLPFPLSGQLRAVFQGRIIVSLRADWKTATADYKSGALVALPIASLSKPDPTVDLITLFTPSPRVSLADVYDTKDFLILSLLDNVKSRLDKLAFVDDKPVTETMPLNTDGTLTVVSTSTHNNKFFVQYESFLTPSTLYLLDMDADGKLSATVAKQLPERFNASDLLAEQLEATSKDGTKVPYFVVRKKDVPRDGSTPTLLYGYGGFAVSMNAHYMEGSGKAWLEKGGAYVLANIRGGGEFGPEWHTAGLMENRQLVYDDFIAVAEDLIASKLTSPAKLGIQGGSNGGLLMGVMFTQRPDLFQAVVCQVPLLDMLRYHKLLAGNSWMGEYGNPDVPEQAQYIRRYSPYQNVLPGKKYPKVFFMTSTKDDRVHPAHARKTAARMEEYGHPFLYYENTEGGHGAAANLEQRAKFYALMYAYLYQQLM
jgi:prolyl oligopeptidase